ncbi:arylformamidase [Metabacillus sp. FJAT-52054]|uniref:Kynurenine formamidase n=1 Tax=Metabacillus sediminis TaxID=3117746 RepID=A0ABZ2NIC3_9BACI
MTWIDISQPLNSKIGHWPGDTPFSYETVYTKEQTGSVNIGKITTSLHSGTHVDAPFHFDDRGPKINELDINLFIGPARVIDMTDQLQISRETVSRYNLDGVTRLLIKTAVPNKPEIFTEKIVPLDPDCGAFLKEKGIFLIGVDVPSVDQLDSKDMAAHHALYKNGVHILENIMLDEIEPGDYDLVALPLPIEGADGSPVRAVIKKRGSGE